MYEKSCRRKVGWLGRGWPRQIASATWAQADLEEGAVRLEPGTTKNCEGRLIFYAISEVAWNKAGAEMS